MEVVDVAAAAGRSSGMAEANGGVRRGFPEMKHKAVKTEALAYYQRHGVSEALEGLLNRMYKVKPEDIYGYMVHEHYRACTLPPCAISYGIPHTPHPPHETKMVNQ